MSNYFSRLTILGITLSFLGLSTVQAGPREDGAKARLEKETLLQKQQEMAGMIQKILDSGYYSDFDAENKLMNAVDSTLDLIQNQVIDGLKKLNDSELETKYAALKTKAQEVGNRELLEEIRELDSNTALTLREKLAGFYTPAKREQYKNQVRQELQAADGSVTKMLTGMQEKLMSKMVLTSAWIYAIILCAFVPVIGWLAIIFLVASLPVVFLLDLTVLLPLNIIIWTQ